MYIYIHIYILVFLFVLPHARFTVDVPIYQAHACTMSTC